MPQTAMPQTAMPQTIANSVQDQTVLAASTVLNEAMSSPLNRIPESMLANCHGVAIIPNVIKGSFIVGARHGKGLLFVRDPEGVWHAPMFVTLTGGNVGWQIGVQSSDIVLVFKTARSIQGILSGKLTLGADAAAAAGPVGRQTAVATDGQLQAEIYSYSRSRGLFAGVSIDGSVLRLDQLSTGAYYRSPGPGQSVVVPPQAVQLTQQIAAYAGTPISGASPEATGAFGNPEFPQRYAASEPDLLRDQMLQLAPELFELLDANWQAYLALPLIPQGQQHADPAAVAEALSHYDAVANDPRFEQLASRPEFRSVHGLLKHYQHALAPQPGNLQLPPPPQS
ncbi:lipid-binding SYLF domain-containing protein [Roseiconus nitratireducens]|nr:lipid-binding SYLF domain-containing protein [Roseiconus nitratireducens]